ncbi:MAG: hypothetical protein O7E52_23580 [Candidatus Poribacteria bacterium]|nr:hypothetical protein [Candidatus Poribacteria bacterium]
MKSHCQYRFWLISLAVHLCLVIGFSYIAINQELPGSSDTIHVSIFKIEPLTAVQRAPRIETVVPVPKPVPHLQVELQSVSTQTLAIRNEQVKSPLVSVPSAVTKDTSVLQPRPQVVDVSLSSANTSCCAKPLATKVDLPLQSDTPLLSGLDDGRLSANSVGTGSGMNFGGRVGRGALSAWSGLDQAHGKNDVGLTSLLDSHGASNVNDSLADVTDNIVLGNGVPELPKGTPGAIVMGRGRDIIGRLNLVRFEDVRHHPRTAS